MPITGFHSEWITIKKHRICLEGRASYPDDLMKFIAQVAVEVCDNNSEGDARVVRIYYDDKACIWIIFVASVDQRDKELEDRLRTVLHTIFNHGNCQPEIVIVKPGDTSSDHYNHTEHLSTAAEVAVDRWRHSDEKYQEKVSVPR